MLPTPGRLCTGRLQPAPWDGVYKPGLWCQQFLQNIPSLLALQLFFLKQQHKPKHEVDFQQRPGQAAVGYASHTESRAGECHRESPGPPRPRTLCAGPSTTLPASWQPLRTQGQLRPPALSLGTGCSLCLQHCSPRCPPSSCSSAGCSRPALTLCHPDGLFLSPRHALLLVCLGHSSVVPLGSLEPHTYVTNVQLVVLG